MKVIAQRVWSEPAAFVGLVVTLALLIVNLLAGSDWDAALIVTVLGPFASALGIRQLVSPAAGPRPADGATEPLAPEERPRVFEKEETTYERPDRPDQPD